MEADLGKIMKWGSIPLTVEPEKNDIVGLLDLTEGGMLKMNSSILNAAQMKSHRRQGVPRVKAIQQLINCEPLITIAIMPNGNDRSYNKKIRSCDQSAICMKASPFQLPSANTIGHQLTPFTVSCL